VYDYRKITVEIVEQGIFRATVNESLVIVLLTNLLKNAFVHNIDGGRIRILITQHSITFCNTGIDHPLEAAHIFERFYQGTKREGSTGLGLAIADSICRLQHWTIRYYFEAGEHCFEVKSQPAMTLIKQKNNSLK
jgi:signal transduction histidine kinase